MGTFKAKGKNSAQNFSEFQRCLWIECGEKKGTVDKTTEEEVEEKEEELYHVLIKHHTKRYLAFCTTQHT